MYLINCSKLLGYNDIETTFLLTLGATFGICQKNKSKRTVIYSICWISPRHKIKPLTPVVLFDLCTFSCFIN